MTDKNLIEDRINISLNSANAILKPLNSSIGYLPSFISNGTSDAKKRGQTAKKEDKF